MGWMILGSTAMWEILEKLIINMQYTPLDV